MAVYSLMTTLPALSSWGPSLVGGAKAHSCLSSCSFDSHFASRYVILSLFFTAATYNNCYKLERKKADFELDEFIQLTIYSWRGSMRHVMNKLWHEFVDNVGHNWNLYNCASYVAGCSSLNAAAYLYYTAVWEWCYLSYQHKKLVGSSITAYLLHLMNTNILYIEHKDLNGICLINFVNTAQWDTRPFSTN